MLALLFFGAMFWAKGRDPFQRVWFKVKTQDHGKAECIAVLPKMAARPLPVVVYLHGSGGSLLGSGNELRQMAEMGLAAVCMEYNQTNELAFEVQFAALNRYLQRQPWADTNAMAWVGFSLGANRSLAFALKHPEVRPRLLVRISGGRIPELETAIPRTTNQASPHPGPLPSAERGALAASKPSTLNQKLSTILLLHGEQDSVFPIADARRVTAALETNGFRVELRTFPGQTHSFDPNRLVLFRAVGEYCLTRLRGANAFKNYESILSWQARARPLWLFWLPALVWLVAWWYAVLKRSRLERGSERPKLNRWEIGLRWVAGILALLAFGQTALHLVTPQFAVTSRTLGIAREHLVQPKEIPDFNCLSTNSFWLGKRLKTLLEHVELAHYNRELVNWKLDDQIYQQFVLSPPIDEALDGDMNWRRPLWESFYPRIRKESSLEAAAEIVVRHLRERVRIVETRDSPKTITKIWQRGNASERGFEVICVAAWRSAGIPARLAERDRAEFWNGTEWKSAPKTVL